MTKDEIAFNKIQDNFFGLMKDFYEDETTRRFVSSAQLRDDINQVYFLNEQTGADFIWIPHDLDTMIRRFEMYRIIEPGYAVSAQTEMFEFYAQDKRAQKLYEAALILKHATIYGAQRAVLYKLSDFGGKQVRV